MKKSLFSLLIILLLAGCAPNDSSPTKSSTFVGGSEGITIEFLQNAPPSEVFDNNTFPFDVSVKLENEGEFDVPKEKVKVKLVGIDPRAFNNPPAVLQPDEDLEGTQIDPNGRVIPGTVTYVTFPNLSFTGNLPGNTPFIIRTDLCYNYGTKAQAKFCIREDLQSIRESVCEVTGSKPIVSSGSPVQIENFEQNPAGKRKIEFSFDIQHRNTGLISKKDTNCDEDRSKRNRVFVKVDTDDLTPGLSCSGFEGGGGTEGFVHLFNGASRNIRCTQDVSNTTGDFEKLVNIELNFDYEDFTATNLLVKDSD